jgi:adenosylcobinamide kinase/adenosylcobinamide-phosphate guanylyltransferase
MGRLIIVTGGARSGKSTFAEEMAKDFGDNILYVATSIPFDGEMQQRIRKHREQRPAFWETVEAYKNMDVHLKDRLGDKDAVILDCITVMVSNIMLEKDMDWEGMDAAEIDEVEALARKEIEKLIGVINHSDIPFIVVTNELGMGVVPLSVLGRAIRDIAGRTNQMLAKAADEVYLCVSGIPIKIK